eukprot:175621-Alexandrium_andersonii.AAC.1
MAERVDSRSFLDGLGFHRLRIRECLRLRVALGCFGALWCSQARASPCPAQLSCYSGADGL